MFSPTMNYDLNFPLRKIHFTKYFFLNLCKTLIFYTLSYHFMQKYSLFHVRGIHEHYKSVHNNRKNNLYS